IRHHFRFASGIRMAFTRIPTFIVLWFCSAFVCRKQNRSNDRSQTERLESFRTLLFGLFHLECYRYLVASLCTGTKCRGTMAEFMDGLSVSGHCQCFSDEHRFSALSLGKSQSGKFLWNSVFSSYLDEL